MSVSTAQLTRGLNVAGKALRSFGAGVATIGDVGGGLAGIGRAGRALGGAGLKAVSGIFRGIAGAARTAAGAIGGVVRSLLSLPSLIAGGALGALFVSAARGAMDLFEQINRTRVLFGQYADVVLDMSNKMAVAFGISKREFTEGAASFADVFHGAGYADKDVAALSVHMTRLALDATSFRDIPIDAAMKKLHSGLAGNIEPLRDIGVAINEATVKEYAYAHGIARAKSELTESQKVQARVALITTKMAKSHGDLANTANSAANQVRSIAGRFENLKDSIGTTLVGLLLPVFDDINAGLHAMQMAWDTSGLAADKATRDSIAGLNGQAKEVGFVQRIIMYAADAWRSFKIGALDAMIAINDSILKLMDSLRQTAYLLLSTGLQKGRTGFSRADYEKGIESIQDMNRGLVKQRKLAEDSALPSAGIADAFKKAREDIAKTRTGLAMTPALDPSTLRPETGPVKAGETKFASAALAGSQEAASAILKSQFGPGAGAKQPEQETAKNTRRIADGIDRLLLGRNREPIEIKGLPSGQMAAAGFLGAFF